MPSDTRYSDAEVEAWVAEKYPMRGHRTGEMLRALLADRRRLEAHRAALLDIVRIARDAVEAGAIEEVYLSLLRDKIAATDALLGAEVTG